MKKFIKQLERLLGFHFSPQYAFAGGLYFEQEEKKENPTLMFKGGKGGGQSVVEKPVYVPPPAAPAVQMAATQTEALTPEEEAKRKQEATKLGTKSLQIPITTGAEGTGQVGTGAGERTNSAQG
jgi:hypothetical protein